MVVCCNKNAEQYYITHCETGPDRLDKISLRACDFLSILSFNFVNDVGTG